MKSKLLLYALVAVIFTGCSSAYKASQTPDDVYYSPAPAAVASKEKEERKEDRYEDYASADDRYLKMKTRNRTRWSTIDDYDYWYSPNYCYNGYNTYNYNYYKNTYGYFGSNVGIGYGYNTCACSCNVGYSSSVFYPGSFNPYLGYYPTNSYIIRNPRRLPSNVNRPQLGGYTNGSYNNTNNTSTFKKVFGGTGGYNNSNRSTRSSTDTYRSTDRTYTPSSPSSSGSSSGSSGSRSSGGSVSRPGRN